MQQTENIRSIDLFCNDLYEFTCSYGYFVQGKHQQTATFQIFFRKYPFKGQYVVYAGLETVKEFIKKFKFTQQHENYLRKLFPHMKTQYFAWLRQDFSQKITVRGMKEGQIVFANEPLLSYTGPLSLVQIFQTPCLNSIGFASLVATNASRMVKAVYPKKCIQFGTRRAQGPDGALSAAQYAYLGGFIASSNVQCGEKLDMQCMGTMSHAYVTSFASLDEIQEFQIGGVKMKEKVIKKRRQLNFNTHEGQLASFLNFAKAFPHNFTTLIDTYSTLQSGILNTIIVGSALIQAGIQKIGIRLDSGKLGDQSIQCRKLWNRYIPQVQLIISASDDLYEERLVELEKAKSQIDVYAIGTNIATCKKQPALGVVCKLVELDGVPKMKLSSSPQKATYPCIKKIYRVSTQHLEFFDLIALNHEFFEPGSQVNVGTIKNPETNKKKIKTIRLINEEVSFLPVNIKNSRQYVKKSMEELPPKIFQLDSPGVYNVFMTQKYLQAFHKTHDQAVEYLQKVKQAQKSTVKDDPTSPSKLRVLI